MLKKIAGLGCLAFLLCLPLQADHRHHRRHRDRHYAPGYVEVFVGTPYGHGAFVRGFRPAPYGYYGRDYYGRGHGFGRSKHRHRRYFKRHRHYHYDGYCPY